MACLRCKVKQTTETPSKEQLLLGCYFQFLNTSNSCQENALKAENNQRVVAWTQNIAVGNQDYLMKVKSTLGIAGKHRAVIAEDGVYTLKEQIASYEVHSRAEMESLSNDNTIYLG